MPWLLHYYVLALTGDVLTWSLEQTARPDEWKRTSRAAAWCYTQARQLCEQ